MIGVHCGAGCHSRERETVYRSMCRRACDSAVDCMLTGEGASKSVLEALRILECSSLSNAGYNGSFPNADGFIECDALLAEIIEEKLHVGAVGAVKDADNPSILAHHVMVQRKNNPRFPLLICGEGASRLSTGHPPISEDHLHCEENFSQRPEDTVGVIAVDFNGNVSVGCSSGGPLGRPAGRIGPAAIWGAGAYIEQSGDVTIACCSSGIGEDLIQYDFCRALCRSLRSTNLDHGACLKVIKTQMMEFHSACGFIMIIKFADNVEFWSAHSSPSFISAAMQISSSKDRLFSFKFQETAAPNVNYYTRGFKILCSKS